MISHSDRVKNDFLDYLVSVGVSENTAKFYESDINHFTEWFIIKIQELGGVAQNLTESTPYLARSLAGEYKDYLINSHTPTATLNRKLSSLRKLGKFFRETKIVDFDFTEDLTNLTKSKSQQATKPKSVETQVIIKAFRNYLTYREVSPNTIKSYLSDIRQFLDWLPNANVEFN
jgi:site-specific recombinase XerD